ncbi:sodium-dependent glucose transporter 1-like protein [Dinothrombium tinctorium]|uniref:Sodium-dependent glucose transporter 1-like protein n=1 Tax=Dinothrombium tinctorium TaxID=1965070 RepID=A0A3S3RNX4_9ACAR|nr:sodium-dependent glucose transporter 1-like protein [Dinothrombium tinctorium]RWS02557.1 sodium-dependent glucose transporter 1-like protein [Dinothrombium tinctorium]RWS02568.1 sodium-dependent glucose transporter 1-like protein [Dinothrombium tinctorium]RWS02569.1 sodium-dependent glucose transporter 1-like protein [Dinothrombium tinctorium]RWS02570.1 sodium-dependent glucose transporter 1-like protein [Dinothrombium tinctorium]
MDQDHSFWFYDFLSRGFIFKFGDKLTICSILLIAEGICVAFITNAGYIPVYYVLKLVIGFSSGAIKTGCVLVINELWREKSGPFVQLLDFADLLASIASPLLIQPFLSTVVSNKSIEGNLTDTLNFESAANETIFKFGQIIQEFENGTAIDRNQIHISEYKTPSSIWFPLAFFGILMNIAALFGVLLYCFSRKNTNKNYVENEKQVEKTEEKSKKEGDNEEDGKQKRYALLVLIVICVVIVVYQIEIVSFFQFWTTFVVNSDLKLPKSTGVLMMSAFSFAMAISSILAIIFTVKLKPFIIVLTLLACRIIGNLFLIFAGTSVSLYWVGGCFMGFGFGPFNAALFNLLAVRVKITNLIGSLVISAQFFSTATALPVLIGYYIQQSPFVLVYCNLIVICVTLFGLCLVSVLDHWKEKQMEENAKV